MTKRVNSIVAASLNNGIGKNGDLPWRLAKEMKHFAKITSMTTDPAMQNAIVMGRKTWQSIPAKRRPLANRLNVVLSKTMKLDELKPGESKSDESKPDGSKPVESKPVESNAPHHVFGDLLEAIDFLNKQPQIESIFVIGGEQVYRAVLEQNLCDRVYLTRILREFDCDAYYPSLDTNVFSLVQTDEVPAGVQEENGLQYEYLVYERKIVEV